jgi:MFS family permease
MRIDTFWFYTRHFILTMYLLESVYGASKDTNHLESDPTVASIIGAVCYMLIGILFCFLGQKLFRITLFLSGFTLFSIISLSILAHTIPLESMDHEDRHAIYLGLSTFIGFIIGLFCIFFWKFGIFLIGLLGGFTFAMYLLALAPHSLISDGIWRIIFIIINAIICALLVIWFERQVIIVSTSISGAFGIGLGADIFAQTKLVSSTFEFLSAHDFDYNATDGTYIILGCVTVLALIGMKVQFHLYKDPFGSSKTKTQV